MTSYDRFKKLHIDFSLLGLEQRKGDGRYFCTPKGAKIIGNEGVDGIHYCFVKGFDETVFAVDPSSSVGNCVHPLAHSFNDFLRLITACGGTAAVEQAWMWSKSEFDAFIKENPPLPEQQAVFDVLREELSIAPMEDPYDYIHDLQAGFDYSQIPYTKEYSKLLTEVSVPERPKEWQVFFGQPFCSGADRTKPAKGIPAGKNFVWCGRVWHIPTVYVCSKGFVIDLCAEVEPQAITAFENKWEQKEGCLTEEEESQRGAEDPMAVNCEARLNVNGKSLYCQSANYAYWIPEACRSESNVYQDRESGFIIGHYALDPQKGWIFMRCSFAMRNTAKHELKALSLSLREQPVTVYGARFTVSGKGDAVSFTNPVSGEAHTLRVVEYKEQEITMLRRKSEEAYPTHYIEMSYVIEPELPSDMFTVQDCNGGDRVISSDGRTDFVGTMSAVIGGADGPTVFTVSGKSGSGCPTVCSSLYRTAQKQIKWRMVFYKKAADDIEVELPLHRADT